MLTHLESAQGECSATILLQIKLYAALGDGYGEELVGPGFSSYEKVLSADNSTLVDARPEEAGSVLAVRSGENATQWQAVVDSFPQPTMLQGDFFAYLRDNGLPGTIRQLIEHHIQQADALGRFQ